MTRSGLDGQLDTRQGILSVGFEDRPPAARTALFGMQHVLALTGIWLFPSIIGSALDLGQHEVAWIVQGCFFMTGLVTILQSGRFLRLPIVQGPTAVFMVAIIGAASAFDLATAFGSMMVAGVIAALLALPSRRWGLLGQVMRVATDPIVFGTLFVIIGAQLAAIGLSGWFAMDATSGSSWTPFLISLATVGLVMGFTIFGGQTILRRGAIFWGIIGGTVLAALFGPWSLPDVSGVALLGAPQVLPFGFDVQWSVVLLMVLAFLQAGTEAMGMFKLVGGWGGRTIDVEQANRGIFVEYLGSVVGAACGGIGTTSYPENAAIVRMTGIGSRFVTMAAGGIAIVLAFLPKFALLVAGLPGPVLSAASTILFGVIAISGIQMLAEVEWDDLNVMVAAPALMIALGTQFLPEDLVAALPPAVESVVTSPMMVGLILLLLLHLVINFGLRPILARRVPADPDLDQGVERTH